MLDITDIEGIPLDAPKDGAVYYDEVDWGGLWGLRILLFWGYKEIMQFFASRGLFLVFVVEISIKVLHVNFYLHCKSIYVANSFG